MLVLVSFGLVLLATILLIVGLFNDTLGLIYLSIVASVVAAVVLFLAFRLARPKAEKGKEAPEPIEPEGAEDPTTVQPAVGVDDAEDVDVDVDVDDAETDEAEVPVAAAAATSASDDDWMDDDEWDEEVVDFPIADYDDLTVAEIMPLLPQLYSDELDTVIERERGGRNRSRIIGRLEELKVSGTEADDVDDVEDQPIEDDEASSAAVPAAVAPAAASSVFDDDDDDDFFPIADYDDLTVGQIMPLLPQLELDELGDVRQRETAGAGRKTILAEIDRIESGDEAPAAAAEPAPAPARKATTKAVPARKAPARKATAKKSASSKKAASKSSSSKRAGTKRTATKKARSTKKASKPRFPIANYDDLTVADIRPRLSDLSPRQLEQVREREASGAGRRTILKEIDSRLG